MTSNYVESDHVLAQYGLSGEQKSMVNGLRSLMPDSSVPKVVELCSNCEWDEAEIQRVANQHLDKNGGNAGAEWNTVSSRKNKGVPARKGEKTRQPNERSDRGRGGKRDPRTRSHRGRGRGGSSPANHNGRGGRGMRGRGRGRGRGFGRNNKYNQRSKSRDDNNQRSKSNQRKLQDDGNQSANKGQPIKTAKPKTDGGISWSKMVGSGKRKEEAEAREAARQAALEAAKQAEPPSYEETEEAVTVDAQSVQSVQSEQPSERTEPNEADDPSMQNDQGPNETVPPPGLGGPHQTEVGQPDAEDAQQGNDDSADQQYRSGRGPPGIHHRRREPAQPRGDHIPDGGGARAPRPPRSFGSRGPPGFDHVQPQRHAQTDYETGSAGDRSDRHEQHTQKPPLRTPPTMDEVAAYQHEYLFGTGVTLPAEYNQPRKSPLFARSPEQVTPPAVQNAPENVARKTSELGGGGYDQYKQGRRNQPRADHQEHAKPNESSDAAGPVPAQPYQNGVAGPDAPQPQAQADGRPRELAQAQAPPIHPPGPGPARTEPRTHEPAQQSGARGQPAQPNYNTSGYQSYSSQGADNQPNYFQNGPTDQNRARVYGDQMPNGPVTNGPSANATPHAPLNSMTTPVNVSALPSISNSQPAAAVTGPSGRQGRGGMGPPGLPAPKVTAVDPRSTSTRSPPKVSVLPVHAPPAAKPTLNGTSTLATKPLPFPSLLHVSPLHSFGRAPQRQQAFVSPSHQPVQSPPGLLTSHNGVSPFTFRLNQLGGQSPNPGIPVLVNPPIVASSVKTIGNQSPATPVQQTPQQFPQYAAAQPQHQHDGYQQQYQQMFTTAQYPAPQMYSFQQQGRGPNQPPQNAQRAGGRPMQDYYNQDQYNRGRGRGRFQRPAGRGQRGRGRGGPQRNQPRYHNKPQGGSTLKMHNGMNQGMQDMQMYGRPATHQGPPPPQHPQIQQPTYSTHLGYTDPNQAADSYQQAAYQQQQAQVQAQQAYAYQQAQLNQHNPQFAHTQQAYGSMGMVQGQQQAQPHQQYITMSHQQHDTVQSHQALAYQWPGPGPPAM